jgi:flagellar biosynthetic protein FliR
LIAASFKTLPVGLHGLSPEALWQVGAWGGQLFSNALLVALPGLTALLVVNLAFGVMSRAAPSLNLFAVGFPATLACGLAIIYVGLPSVQATFAASLEGTFDLIRSLLNLPH